MTNINSDLGKMKCFKCGAKTDIETTDNKPICLRCVEENQYVICTDLGKVIADKSFCCDHICDDCVYKK